MTWPIVKVKAHQVRALAATQAFYNNAPIESVLQACTWACHNTFSSFYLKNLSQSNSSGYRLCRMWRLILWLDLSGSRIFGKSVISLFFTPALACFLFLSLFRPFWP